MKNKRQRMLISETKEKARVRTAKSCPDNRFVNATLSRALNNNLHKDL